MQYSTVQHHNLMLRCKTQWIQCVQTQYLTPTSQSAIQKQNLVYSVREYLFKKSMIIALMGFKRQHLVVYLNTRQHCSLSNKTILW